MITKATAHVHIGHVVESDTETATDLVLPNLVIQTDREWEEAIALQLIRNRNRKIIRASLHVLWWCALFAAGIWIGRGQ